LQEKFGAVVFGPPCIWELKVCTTPFVFIWEILNVVTCHMRSQCYLPSDTGERTPCSQAGRYLIYIPRWDGMKSWVDLHGWQYSEIVYSLL